MSYSILIVDDSLPMRAVLKKTVKAAGYANAEFHEAGNGEEALAVLKSQWVDIVLSDYNMPVMDGLVFVKTMKADDLVKQIPVVIVSTAGNEAKIQEFRDAGAADYITKPFTAESIRDVIINILGEVDYDEEFDSDDDDFDF